MRDWAITYIQAVLEKKDWSANRLAKEAGLSASTINRPLREPDWPHQISRATLAKIFKASGIDPSEYAPEEQKGPYFTEESAGSGMAEPPHESFAMRSLRSMDDTPGPNAQGQNEIKIAVVGHLAQIVATVDKSGIEKLRKKLDAIESMLDDLEP